jgi:hypothetical protein
LDPQGLKVYKDYKDLLVLLVPILAFQVLRVLLAPWVSKDPLAHRDCRDYKVLLVHKDHRESRVFKVLQVQLVPLVQQDHKASLAL